MARFLQRSIALVPWRMRQSIRDWPLVAPLQRKLLATFLDDREFLHKIDSGPARGLMYPIRLPQDKGIWTGTYELPFATAIATAVQPGDICYDIGAWRGFFSGVMGLAGAGRVYVFEPLPDNALQIRRIIELNPRLPLEMIEAAVGERSGRLEFCVMPETSMGKLAESTFQPNQKGRQCISIDVVAIDDLVAVGRIQLPNLMKIDVEGAEAMVLRGATATLRRARPRLFIETHSPELKRECTDLLDSLGYDMRVVETVRKAECAELREVCHLAAWPDGEGSW